MTQITVATQRGLLTLGSTRPLLEGADVTSLAAGRSGLWALIDRREITRISRGEVERLAMLPELSGMCLARDSGALFIGTERSGLFRYDSAGLARVAGFDEAPGRAGWSQPPGKRPATTWTLACGAGLLYVNVHVGGILRSRDAGASFLPTIDPEVDVHQVALGGDSRVWAATGERGLAESRDCGENWSFHASGLHATYLTCVAPVDDGVLVVAASGFGSDDDAVYRFDGRTFTRAYGLPASFGGALYAGKLVARERHAAVAGSDGVLYTSEDAGRSWRQAADGLPSVRAIVIG